LTSTVSTTRALPDTRVVAVLVIYERSLDRVEGWPALNRMLQERPPCGVAELAHLLVYDNSRAPLSAVPELPGLTYRHDPENGGTAAAYRVALAMAMAMGAPWLLLLDDDTALPLDYLRRMTPAFLSAVDAPDIAALLPRVRHGEGVLISPVRVTRWGTMQPLAVDSEVRAGEHVSAIASGAILRVSALSAVMPLPADLWLDYVDHWIFAAMHRKGLKAIVADEVLQHDLSIRSPATMSPARLASVLRGEANFHRVLGVGARLAYPFRLARRLAGLGLTNPRLAVSGLRSLFASRAARP
jgi:hypothetical protein